MCLASPGAWRVPIQTSLPPQILVHSIFLEIGCLERELCFRGREAIFDKSCFAQGQKRPAQHWAGSSFPLVFSHWVTLPASGIGCGVAFRLTIMNPQVSLLGLSSHLFSPPTTRQAPTRETGSAEEGPEHRRATALGRSVWISAPTD